MLDTNVVVGLIGRKSASLARRVLESTRGSLALPSVVAHELYYGAFKSHRFQFNLETLQFATAAIPILDFNAQDAFAAAELRAILAKLGTPIGPYDVLIAGQAKARGLTVVTNNIREFSRVEGLKVEDWTL